MPEDQDDSKPSQQDEKETASILERLEQEDKVLEPQEEQDEQDEQQEATDPDTLEDREDIEEEEEGEGEEEIPDNIFFGGGPLLQAYLQEDDLVELYLLEIKRYPLLTKEGEDDLARRAQTGDSSAITSLIESNLRLVVYIARRYVSRGLDLMDLIQEGNYGLMRAAPLYDPDQPVRFSTFVGRWIKLYIRSAIRKALVSRVSSHIADHLMSLKRVQFILMLAMGEIEPSEEVELESYNALEIIKVKRGYSARPHIIGLEEYRRMARWIDQLPLDDLLAQEARDEELPSLIDTGTLSPEEAAILANRRAMLIRYVEQCGLSKQQKLVTKFYFGLFPDRLNIPQLATRLKVSKQAIGGYLTIALSKLRAPDNEKKRQQMLSDFWGLDGESYDESPI